MASLLNPYLGLDNAWESTPTHSNNSSNPNSNNNSHSPHSVSGPSSSSSGPDHSSSKPGQPLLNGSALLNPSMANQWALPPDQELVYRPGRSGSLPGPSHQQDHAPQYPQAHHRHSLAHAPSYSFDGQNNQGYYQQPSRDSVDALSLCPPAMNHGHQVYPSTFPLSEQLPPAPNHMDQPHLSPLASINCDIGGRFSPSSSAASTPSFDPRTLSIDARRFSSETNGYRHHISTGRANHGSYDSGLPSPATSVKRRSSDAFGVDEAAKRMRISPLVEPMMNLGGDSHSRMTTILCLHASVAQKSYGQEKRFLCPPPMLRMSGPLARLPKIQRPVLSMSILTDDGTRQLSQTSNFVEDDFGALEPSVYFKALYISGNTTKAKAIHLELSLHPPPPPNTPAAHSIGPPPDRADLPAPFATFQSDACTIISKPSKKTAKARNIQSCLMNGSTLCLFNRINSQTVRTKYLCVHDGQLAVRAAQWSAFTIKVVRRAEEDYSRSVGKTLLTSSIPLADQTITYGSEVVLIDFVTGVTSQPLIVRKVEKNYVLKDCSGPVSQMQKLALCTIDGRDGVARYITALAAGGPGQLFDPSRPGSYGGMGVPAAPGTLLNFSTPRSVVPAETEGGMTMDEIEDSSAWTVMGVSHFSYSFFDASAGPTQIPRSSLTPFPSVRGTPVADFNSSALSLRVTNFFATDPASGTVKPLQVWLGPLGPLKTTIVQAGGVTVSAADSDSPNGIPGARGGHGELALQTSKEYDAVNAEGPGVAKGSGARRESSIRCELPPLVDIARALYGITGSASSPLAQHGEVEGMQQMSAPGIQAAVRAIVHQAASNYPRGNSNPSTSPSGYPLASPGFNNNGYPTRPSPSTSPPPQLPPSTLAITFVRPDGISYASERGVTLESREAPCDFAQWREVDRNEADWRGSTRTLWLPKVV